jgi:DNA-directed RNA polymerase II subunit RPB2
MNLSKNKMSNNTLEHPDIFGLTDLYFERYGIIYSHLYNSYNKFIEEDIRLFLEKGDHVFFEFMAQNKLIKYKFIYENIGFKGKELDGEPMFPMDAMDRNLTYSGKLIAKVTQIQEITDITTGEIIKKVIGHPEEAPVAILPIMLRSKFCSYVTQKGYNKKECFYDPGGYFIVKGSEKVIISQDKMIENKPMAFIKKDSGANLYTVQVNSRSFKPNGMTQILNIRMKSDGIINIQVPILTEVPVFAIFRALGVESDKDIIDSILYDEQDNDILDILKISLENCRNDKGIKIQTKQDAIDYLINKMRVIKKYSESDLKTKIEQKKLHLEDLLKNNFMPHIEGSNMKRAKYLGYMINKLIRLYIGRIKPDDRDSYLNKKVETPGDLLFELFKQYYRKMINECNKFFKKRNASHETPLNIIKQINPSTIEQGINSSLATGAWPRRKGVAQVAQRNNYIQLISFLRRVDSPGGDASSSKLTSPRHLHSSATSFLCAISTPEHAKVGLTKHLTLIGSITIGQASQINIIKNYLKEKIINIEDVTHNELQKYIKVFLNGDWMGTSMEPIKLLNELKEMKYKGDISNQISIVLDVIENEIRINTDSGRLTRPIFVVDDNNEIKLTREMLNKISIKKSMANKGYITSWDEFMTKYPGVIEYIDAEEQQFGMISYSLVKLEEERIKMINSIEKVKEVKTNKITNRYDDMLYVKYSHCDFHPSLLLGEIPINIPFCNHNAGPRNIFFYAQAKQAMGIYASNYRDRLDISYILYHPQQPLVNTRTAKYVYGDVLPTGENAVVAIMPYGGYNQEDSIVFNQSALDRGLFRSMNLKKYVQTIQKNQSTSQDDLFMKPDPNKVAGMRHGVYDKLNDKGYVPEETQIVNNDIIIGKVTPIQTYGSNTTKIYKDSSEIYKSNVPAVVNKVYSGIINWEGYEMIKMSIRSERKPGIGDKFSCYDENTEVLTTNGWKSIKDITLDDYVATLQNKNTLKYEKPTEVQSYDYKGDMYYVNSNQINLLVTPNHRMFVGNRVGKNYEMVMASDVYGKRRTYMKNVENIDTKGLTEFTIKGFDGESDLVLPINEWLWFFGIWIAEGCVGKISDKAVFISAHKQRVKDKLTEIEEALGLEIKTKKDGKEKNNDDGKNIWYFRNKTLWNYFYSLNVKAITKYLPDWVWELNREQCQTLIAGMVLGDGHTMDNGTQRYDTSSTRLADDFQRLCLHAGWSANKSLKAPKGNTTIMKNGYVIKSNADAWRLTIIKSQNNPLVNKNIKTNGDQRVDEWVDFDGKVYCCTVPGDGIIYVRRQGVVGWCGNSRNGQKGTIGITMKHSDMPFTKDGITPDLCINPNCMVSRMTIAQLIETLTGKIGAISGSYIDGTPFVGIDIDKTKDELEKLGYHRTGYEYLINGMTGLKEKTMICIGPTYYQRLKHQTQDKIHCLTLDHEVLTNKGWKYYNELTLEDKIATLNRETRELEYQKPTHLHYYPNYEGKMYEIKNSNINLNVTYEHRMYVAKTEESQFELIMAKDIINKPVKYMKTAIWNKENKINCDIYDNFDITQLSRKKCDELVLSYVNNNSGYHKKWQSCLIGDDKLILFINKDNLNNCNNINDECKISEEDILKMADKIQHLCLHAGYYADIHNTSSNITVLINLNHKNVSIQDDKNYEERIYNYTGEVFCVTVPNEIFYVRRGGKACWTGNSRARGPRTNLTRQAPEGRSRDGGLRLGESYRKHPLYSFPFGNIC